LQLLRKGTHVCHIACAYLLAIRVEICDLLSECLGNRELRVQVSDIRAAASIYLVGLSVLVDSCVHVSLGGGRARHPRHCALGSRDK